MRGSVQEHSIIPAYAGGTIGTNTDTNGGVTIDTQGFEKVGFAVHTGAYTDGSYLLKIFETDNADGTTGAVETTLYTTQPAVGVWTANAVKKVEAKTFKRYARLVITSTAVTTGVVVKSAVAILSDARNNPVA